MNSRTLTFLLVEDDDSHATLTTRMLRNSDGVGDIHRVCDGAEALAFLRREGEFAQSNPPDLILLDLKLPKLSGHEVLAAVKNDPSLFCIPVIILTTSDAPQDRREAYRHHVNSYLVKPPDYQSYKQLAADLMHYWGRWNRNCDAA